MDKNDSGNFSRDLLRWFYRNKRDLPWRQTKDPYHIWVSEVMLQQTQVDTVIPYYNKFMRRFPTLFDLAEAEEQSVLKNWEGLGYYSRARNLQQGVREVVEKYGGKVPDCKKDILSIRGIGPYTAGAVLSIAYDIPEPAVDGNVMRVLARVFLIDDDISKQKTRKLFEEKIAGLMPEDDPSGFNQGLMELGALICRPKQPKCEACPLQSRCMAYAEGVQSEYPVKKKKAAAKPVDYAVLALQDSKGRLLIEKRPEKGLLAGLWQLPMVNLKETAGLEQVEKAAEKDCGGAVHLEKTSFYYKHQFSHLTWHLSLYEGRAAGPLCLGEKKWADVSELADYPFPVPHQKVIEWLKKEKNEFFTHKKTRSG